MRNEIEAIRSTLRDVVEGEAIHDTVEPDLNLISAWCDGLIEVGSASEGQLAKHIAESPRAFSVLVRTLPKGMSLPQFAGGSEGIHPSVRLADTAVGRSRRLVHLTPALAASVLAVAALSASLLMAVQSIELRKERNTLLSKQALQNKLSEKAIAGAKSELARKVIEAGPLYLSGRTTPTLIQLALKSATIAQRGDTISGPLQFELDQSRSLLENAIDLNAGQSPDSAETVEKAIAAIWCGDVTSAELLLQRNGTDRREPAVLNAQGVLWVQQSELQKEDANTLLGKAELAFREAAENGEKIGWINLAVMYQSQGRSEEAVAALQQFVSVAETSEAQIVHEFLSPNVRQ